MSWQTIVKENNLEVSIIPANKLEGAIRLDSDYYQVKYLKNKQFLGTKECKTILELTDYVKKGIFDISPEKYLEEGIPLIRVKDIKGGFLDYSTMVFISEEDHTKEKKTELNIGDIVFSKVGTVG
jgi:type I restriction enzyme S subunit